MTGAYPIRRGIAPLQVVRQADGRWLVTERSTGQAIADETTRGRALAVRDLHLRRLRLS
jgi:hypothetical protein